MLLPYHGISVRVAPAAGCNASSSIGGKVDPTAGRAILATCTSSRGGTPSPQTLVEWTFTRTPPDVIDTSFVDGYSMPVRLEYKTEKSRFKTILGKMTESGCVKGGGKKVMDKKGNYAGCQSPCSATGDARACCSDQYGTPATCHPNGKPASPALPPWCDAVTRMFHDADNRRVGYCYAYDDDVGSIIDQEKGIVNEDAPRVKITFCDYA